MAAEDCIDAIRKAFGKGRELSDQEIEDITEAVQEQFRERSADGTTSEAEAWVLAAGDVANEAKTAAQVDARNKKLNILAKKRITDMMNEADKLYGDPSIGIMAAMVGTNKPLSGGRRSVDATNMAMFNKYMGGMIAEMETKGLLAQFNSGNLDLDIARALEQITKKTARGTENRAAREIASIIHKHRTVALDRRNRAGAWTKNLDGFIANQAHDQVKMRRAGFEEWRDTILPLLDEEATFKGGDSKKFLDEAYKTLVTGQGNKTTEADIDLKLAFTGPGNLAKRRSRHRKLHFKDADSWAQYNTQFGQRSIREAVLSEMHGMARDTAMMEMFGTNPRVMVFGMDGNGGIMGEMRQKFRDSGETKKFDRLARGNLNERGLQAQMNVIDGTAAAAGNITFANVGATARNIQSMSKLGGAAISSITDLAMKAQEIRYQDGGGILSPLAKSITTFFDGIPTKDHKAVGDLLGVGMEGAIGDIGARVGTGMEDGVPGMGSRLMRIFFKLNLLGPWTDANKRGLGMMIARNMAVESTLDFANLAPHRQRQFNHFNIEAKHWEVARQATRKAPDGITYLFPDEIQNLPDDVFKKNGLDPVRDRDFVETAFRSYLVDSVDHGVPTPGARERAILTLGEPPGTILGEAMRAMMQFKAFPVTVLSKVVGRAKYANLDGTADKSGLAMMIATSTMLGYGAMAMKDIAKGRNPRDPKDPATWTAAFLQGGGAGIFGDFFLGETNRFGRSFLDTIAGPTIGTISDIDQLRARLMAGEDATATALRIATGNTPFLNLFYTRAVMDYLVLYQLQEMANPGYLRRAERRLKKEQNQTYFLKSPAQIIPRGGGAPNF